jgi:hypothetical protein
MHLLTSLTPGQSQSWCLQFVAVAKIEGAIWVSSRSANQGAFWRNERLWARFRVFDRAMTSIGACVSVLLRGTSSINGEYHRYILTVHMFFASYLPKENQPFLAAGFSSSSSSSSTGAFSGSGSCTCGVRPGYST